MTWRNSIAHDDIDIKLARGALSPLVVNLDTCRTWRMFNEPAIAEDLTPPSACRSALDLLRRELDRHGGLPLSRLRRWATSC